MISAGMACKAMNMRLCDIKLSIIRQLPYLTINTSNQRRNPKGSRSHPLAVPSHSRIWEIKDLSCCRAISHTEPWVLPSNYFGVPASISTKPIQLMKWYRHQRKFRNLNSVIRKMWQRRKSITMTSSWHHHITTSPHQFHVDLQGSACRSQWKCFVKVTIGTAPTLVFSRTKCLPAALLGTSLVRRVRLCVGTSSDASYTPKLILKKVNEMSQWAMPLRLAIQACSLHWRSSIVICKAVIADRNGIASSRSCLKRFVAPNSIVLCNSVSVDGSGVSVYRFRFWSCNFCWFCE